MKEKADVCDYTAILLREKRTKYLWGTGNVASYISDLSLHLETDNWADIQYVVDNDELKRGKIFKGIEIKHPKDIFDWKDVFIIVAIGDVHYGQIKKQLEGYSLEEEKDFISWEKLDNKIILGITAFDENAAASLYRNEKMITSSIEAK